MEDEIFFSLEIWISILPFHSTNKNTSGGVTDTSKYSTSARVVFSG